LKDRTRLTKIRFLTFQGVVMNQDKMAWLTPISYDIRIAIASIDDKILDLLFRNGPKRCRNPFMRPIWIGDKRAKTRVLGSCSV
jgi:hypothetical protein